MDQLFFEFKYISDSDRKYRDSLIANARKAKRYERIRDETDELRVKTRFRGYHWDEV